MPAECDGSAPPTWQVSQSLGGFRSEIVFAGQRVAVEQVTATTTVGKRITPRLGWAVSLGAIVDGSVEGRDLGGGGAAGASASWLAVLERARRPFVAVTASAGAALARATADDGTTRSWLALDLRGGAMIGKTLAGRWVPYAAARAFGGPVAWRRGGQDVVGGDRYHVTAGAGLTVRLPGDLDVTAELMPLGERSATLGVTLRL